MKELADKTLQSGLATFVDNINTASEVIAKKLVDASPKAVELILAAIRIEALVSIAYSFAAAGLCYVSYKVAKKAFISVEEGDLDVSAGAPILMISALFCILCGVASMIHIGTDEIIAAISPEASLALKALQSVGVN